MSHIKHVIAGHKATLHNPNTSDEAKQHSRDVLDEMQAQYDANMQELTERQARGHLATLHNPNASDEAKKHSEQVLSGEAPPVKPKDEARVLAGHKANLTNPNTRLETKVHSVSVLAENDAL